jgi:hypothetical protein
MADFELRPGGTYDVLDELKEDFQVEPEALWRGLWRLEWGDYLEGDRVKVQLQGMKTTTLHIGAEVMEVFPENFEMLYRALQDEFGWGDLVFVDSRGTIVTSGYALEGATLAVPRISGIGDDLQGHRSRDQTVDQGASWMQVQGQSNFQRMDPMR